MIQPLYTIGMMQELKETHVDIPTFHFHNFCARISKYYCCGWNTFQVELVSYISVVKPYIKHPSKQFIKTLVQVPIQTAQTRYKNYVLKVRGVGQTK